VKDWEIIADNLNKGGWNCGGISAVDLEGEQSGFWTRIATESGSSCVPMKS